MDETKVGHLYWRFIANSPLKAMGVNAVSLAQLLASEGYIRLLRGLNEGGEEELRYVSLKPFDKSVIDRLVKGEK